MRVENWEIKMLELMHTAEITPFSWGEFDCFTWTAWFAERLTGKALAKEFCSSYGLELSPRPYMTTKGMIRAMYRLGCSSFFELVSKIYGEHINATFASRGDIVMIHLPDLIMPSLGICRGIDSMFKTRYDNVFVPTSKCAYAWRVN